MLGDQSKWWRRNVFSSPVCDVVACCSDEIGGMQKRLGARLIILHHPFVFMVKTLPDSL